MRVCPDLSLGRGRERAQQQVLRLLASETALPGCGAPGVTLLNSCSTACVFYLQCCCLQFYLQFVSPSARPDHLLSNHLPSATKGGALQAAGRGRQAGVPHTRPAQPLTRVAWPAALAEGPSTMLTLLDDWVSLVLLPSAAESPEMTRALEKLLLPKRKLRVELLDEPRLDLISASARSRTLRWPVVLTGGG